MISLESMNNFNLANILQATCFFSILTQYFSSADNNYILKNNKSLFTKLISDHRHRHRKNLKVSSTGERKWRDGVYADAGINDDTVIRNDFEYINVNAETKLDSSIPVSYLSSSKVNVSEEITLIEHEPLRIFFETSNLLKYQDTYIEHYERVAALVDTVLPAAGQVWSSVLSVPPIKRGIKVKKSTCFGQIDVPDHIIKEGLTGTDIVIFVKEANCMSEDQMAFASPCALSSDNDRPLVGLITFCLNSLETDQDGKVLDKIIKDVTDVAIHEIGHILGVYSALFPYFRDAETGKPLTPRPIKPTHNVTCVDGNLRSVLLPANNTVRSGVTSTGVTYYEVVTPRVATVVKNQFNCESMVGARLENDDTNSEECFGSHWDERLFYTEAMGAIFGELTNTLSPLTLALLEDSGWYKVNYEVAEISTFGHGAGCDFVNKPCIIDGEVPSHADGFFCNSELIFDDEGEPIVEPTCDVTNNHVMACDLVDRSMMGRDLVPFEYQYFSNPNLGPFTNSEQVDYCPMPSFYVHSCHDTTREPSVKGESFGFNSKCFNFEMEKSNGEHTIRSAHCLEAHCDKESHTLKVIIAGSEVTCEYDGQIHPYPMFSLSTSTEYLDMVFKCPRLAVVCPNLICPANCSGRGICNYSDLKPRCDCFDETDKTSGCFGQISLNRANITNPSSMVQIMINTSSPTTSPTITKTITSIITTSQPTNPPAESDYFMRKIEPTANPPFIIENETTTDFTNPQHSSAFRSKNDALPQIVIVVLMSTLLINYW